jgi:hypothetical protein
MRGKRVLTLGRRSLDSKNQHKSNKSNMNISINRNYNKLEKLNSNSNFITKKKNYKISSNRPSNSLNNERHSILYSSNASNGFNSIKNSLRVPSNNKVETYSNKLAFSNPNLM